MERDADAGARPGSPVVLSADVLATALGLPSPTPEQVAVIEAPEAPALVVAGAGSGKTETMAARVVWLVANGRVHADEVLGLTFTRKAAGELAERIGKRLATVDEYRRRDLLPHLPALVANGTIAAVWERVGRASPRIRQAALASALDELTGTSPTHTIDADALLQRPRVATYNAFADTLVREHGARIGRDPDSALLSQSASWLLARRVVIGASDERLIEREEAFSSVVDAVQRMAGEALDNRVDLGALAEFGRTWAHTLASYSYRLKKDTSAVASACKNLGALPLLADLVAEYARRKEVEDTLDFADQVAGALEIIERAPDVAAHLREQYRVVLLDEYQDTSVIQTELLAEVFHDSAVMAVGDPQQSIYGWRGASADNLSAFPAAFARESACGRFTLMVSWRNDIDVLTAANGLLAAGPGTGPGAGAGVEALRARPGAPEGRVEHHFADSVDAEAAAVARWFAERRAEHAAGHATGSGPDAPPHSGAILFRTKRHMQLFSEALDAAGVPNRILGLGGLLQTPEVVDVVAALRVVHDPTQGSSLIRLLAGPRFAVGVADLAALQALAQTLSHRDAALAPLDPELVQRVRGSAGVDEQLSIIDALEFVGASADDHRLLQAITPIGRERLRDAAAMFERLRRGVGQPIPELIRLIELELRLDIELGANEARGPARTASARLRTFLDEVRAFLLADERGSVGSLLAWLDHAEETDELMPRPEPPEPGVVQLLTIHASKGLEWDAVAVVRLVAGELPKTPRSKQGWLGFGVLPYPLRGDSAALPALDWRLGDDEADLPPAIEAFTVAEGAHQEREERRLAYVAVTRARGDLLLTGAFWAGQKQSRKPSPYLQEMLAALGRDEIDADDPGANPYAEAGGRVETWPLDPLGARGPRVRDAAQAVDDALAAPPATPDEVLERLLAEREERRAPAGVDAPRRIPASRFKDYIGDFAGTVGAISRPMPERPYRQTRLGTLFHAWVEQRSELAGVGTSPDDALWELDDESDEATEASVEDATELARLQANFEASEWGPLRPIEVEGEIDFAFADGRIVICKLDAVYRRGGRIEIVDWKTGRAPTSAKEIDERMLQLALYRVAYHRAHGIPLEEIDVALYYVGDDRVIRQSEVYSEEELAQRWSAARDARSASRSISSSVGTRSAS